MNNSATQSHTTFSIVHGKTVPLSLCSTSRCQASHAPPDSHPSGGSQDPRLGHILSQDPETD